MFPKPVNIILSLYNDLYKQLFVIGQTVIQKYSKTWFYRNGNKLLNKI